MTTEGGGFTSQDYYSAESPPGIDWFPLHTLEKTEGSFGEILERCGVKIEGCPAWRVPDLIHEAGLETQDFFQQSDEKGTTIRFMTARPQWSIMFHFEQAAKESGMRVTFCDAIISAPFDLFLRSVRFTDNQSVTFEMGIDPRLPGGTMKYKVMYQKIYHQEKHSY